MGNANQSRRGHSIGIVSKVAVTRRLLRRHSRRRADRRRVARRYPGEPARGDFPFGDRADFAFGDGAALTGTGTTPTPMVYGRQRPPVGLQENIESDPRRTGKFSIPSKIALRRKCRQLGKLGLGDSHYREVDTLLPDRPEAFLEALGRIETLRIRSRKIMQNRIIPGEICVIDCQKHVAYERNQLFQASNRRLVRRRRLRRRRPLLDRTSGISKNRTGNRYEQFGNRAHRSRDRQ